MAVTDATLLALFDREMRIGIEYFDARREATPDVVRQVSRNGPEGAILYTFCDPSRTRQVIQEEMAYFRAIGQGCEWMVYTHDHRRDLIELLPAVGWRAEQSEALLILATAQLADTLPAAETADVRRVTAGEGLDAVRLIEEGVWAEDFARLVENLAAEMDHDPEAVSCYVAYAHGRPAGCAWVRFHTGAHFASLWGGATLPDYRRRGLYSALVAARIREASARGFPYVSVHASAMSAPILLRCGFRQLSTCTPYKLVA